MDSRLKIVIVFFCLNLSSAVSLPAQTYPYLMDFEPANTSPVNKNSYASLDTITVDSIQWIMPGVHLGSPIIPPGDFFNDSRSARIRLTDNTKGDPGYMEMLGDLPSGAGYIRFNTAMYGKERGGKLLVYYSVDSGTSWTAAGDTIKVPPNGTPASVSRDISQTGKVRIKIQKADHTKNRINVDDIYISRYGTIANIQLLAKSPEGQNIPLAIDKLTIQYDHLIAAASGTINLYQTGGQLQSFTVPSSNVTISDSTATISGIRLENAAHYYVLMDNGIFYKKGDTVSNKAITDSTFWTFSTRDTTPPPPPPVLRSLNESFLACNQEVNMMGVFRQFSVEGSKTWTCSSGGHGDSFCVSMSGGWYTDVSENSEDWLISALPFDLSAMNDPVLTLWQKKEYEGYVHRSIKIASGYDGIGNPLDSSMNWVNLNVPELTVPPANTWTKISAIDLSAYKNTPFYLAFTYDCADSGAYILFYDDLRIQERPVSIKDILPGKTNSLKLKVLGHASPNELTLNILSAEAAALEIQIYNLNGQKVYEKAMYVHKGKNTQTFFHLDLTPGMYVIRAQSSLYDAVTKAIVK